MAIKKPKKEKEKKKKVVEESTYLVRRTRYSDGTTNIQRLNDGFTVLEIAGLAGWILQELVGHINNVAPLKVDKVTRQYAAAQTKSKKK